MGRRPHGRRPSDILISRFIQDPRSRISVRQQPERSTRVGLDHHLHAHRRGAAWRRTRSCRSSRRTPRRRASSVETRDISLAGPHHRQLPRAPRRQSSASATRWPSSASWPRRPRPTSSSCPTSAPRSRSSRRRSPSCRRRATRCRTTRTTRRPTRSSDVRAPLRQGQGQRRQPGAARGQLRPPRARRR